MSNFKLFLGLFIMMVLFQGCDTTASSSSNDITIKSTNSDKTDNLTTLSVENTDISAFVMKEKWKSIKIDISAFYESSNLPSVQHTYTIDMQFAKKSVVAYADCQKVSANYKIVGKEISFSKVSVAPAIELATCIESEYADDAVLTLFENSFEVTKITEKEVVLDALDFDTNIVLKR
jgi:hypothetical protein